MEVSVRLLANDECPCGHVLLDNLEYSDNLKQYGVYKSSSWSLYASYKRRFCHSYLRIKEGLYNKHKIDPVRRQSRENNKSITYTRYFIEIHPLLRYKPNQTFGRFYITLSFIVKGISYRSSEPIIGLKDFLLLKFNYFSSLYIIHAFQTSNVVDIVLTDAFNHCKEIPI